MENIRRLVSVLACAAILAGAGPEARSAEPEKRFSDSDVQEIEQIVRDYLIRNPSIMREVFTALETEEEAARKAKLLATVEERRDDLLFDERDAVLGNPAGDVTLVEFFDYNCGYCKRALSDLQALLDADPKLRVVLKEFPILTPGSVEAARVSMAAAEQPGFWKFHTELLGSRGAADGKKALRIAREAGLDMALLEAKMQDPGIADAIAATQELASELGVEGTPGYLVGTTLIPGAIGVEGLRDAIEEARQTACQTC